ncbi:hypothetical protein FKP32DRAFT_1589374 [Trametes sanguinea]|nr:hypothetical protein FKP32DRAFT_1589374 [Trametes sanguinea]
MADEYDDLPDAFEGIDFDQIPELSTIHTPADNGSDYDQFFDEIDPAALDSIPHLGPVRAPSPPVTPPATPGASAHAVAAPLLGLVNPRPQSPRAASTAPSAASTQYTFDDVDDAFFREVSQIEQNASAARSQRRGANRRSQSIRSTPRASPHHDRARTPNQRSSSLCVRSPRRIRSARTSTTSISQMSKSSKQGKKKTEGVDPHASARQILAKFEEELNCPICYDLLIATHTTIPCGHSCCGQCLLTFLRGRGSKAQCPVCRTKLDRARPLIPAFTLDHVVQNHVSSLEQTGSVDWQPTGQRRLEFAERKAQSARISEQIAQYRIPPESGVGMFDNSQEIEDEDEDDYYSD